MPFRGSNFFNKDTGINTRNFEWKNSGGVGVEIYPAEFDDVWRWIEWGNMQIVKIATPAVANAFLDIQREGTNTFNQIWGRHFDSLEVTTGGAAALQGGEMRTLPDTYSLTTAGFMPSGILIPARCIIRLFSNAIGVDFEGVIHESLQLSDLEKLF